MLLTLIDSLLSHHLVSPRDLIHAQSKPEIFRKVCEHDREFCYYDFCFHKAIEGHKRVSTRLENNTDNLQSQDKHYKGSLGISQKVLQQPRPMHAPRALTIVIWRIMSAMQHSLTCSVETSKLHEHNTLFSAAIAL